MLYECLRLQHSRTPCLRTTANIIINSLKCTLQCLICSIYVYLTCIKSIALICIHNTKYTIYIQLLSGYCGIIRYHIISDNCFLNSGFLNTIKRVKHQISIFIPNVNVIITGCIFTKLDPYPVLISYLNSIILPDRLAILTMHIHYCCVNIYTSKLIKCQFFNHCTCYLRITNYRCNRIRKIRCYSCACGRTE